VSARKDIDESIKWRHPGGKLRELGPESLTDAELLSILISSGIKGKSAETLAKWVIASLGVKCCIALP